MILLFQTISLVLYLLWFVPSAVAEQGKLLPPSANAQDEIPKALADLKIEQAVELALERNPILEAEAAALRAEEAKLHRAAAIRNPTLELSGENFAGNGKYRGMQALEATVSLSQRFEIGNDRERRQQLAQAQKNIRSIGGEIARRDLIAAVKEAFVNTLEAQALLEVEREGLILSKHLEGVVAKYARAGGGSPVDLSKAAIDLAKAKLRVASAEDALDAARVRLAAFWGEGAPSFTKVVGSLAITEPLPEFDKQRIEQSLAASRSQAEHQLGLATVADAQALAQPDLTLSGGIRYFRENGNMAAVFVASMPITVFDHGSVEEARQRASESLARSQVTKLQLSSDLIVVRSRLQAAVRELQALDETLIPKAKDGLKILEKSYSVGASSYIELATANQSLLELKLRRVAVSCETQRQRYQYDRLLGTKDSTL